MKTETLSKQVMTMFADLEERLATDYEGDFLLKLYNYLGQMSSVLKTRLMESKNINDKKHIKKLQEAAHAGQKIICVVWKNFHSKKRLPI